jgi:hypothetical protein
MIFVNSMSDLFHKEVPTEFIDRVFETMERASWHTFQVLTKRSSLMRNYLRRRYGAQRGPIHIWFGVSVEDGSKKSRIRHLHEALTSYLASEQNKAEEAFVSLVPEAPASIVYDTLWPQILSRYVVRLPDVNQMGTKLRRTGRLLFPDWEANKRVPQPRYRIQRPK